ncbi:MAG: AbrB/MazE/SpoVT family DNA-binding domain-containing protein [Nitrososphaeria archaeon]|nr:AbrB/MazE/SpoVT family DNA-binding domain-containing protein [Nitrosopumilaceae archaeon]NIP09814.1 AbrB/MazE/SpoVT family DNA-binding domain-containing protein [Nitrosopumilaceae archaeon]NIP91838.1 AbrB/MazE/SpoVT family DNA-binding domain-containing protein [Nitrososphaeria archaeon]NIS95897.1 AbrB/MazE/SpoVT family DNA-binding domain-containing protein [Nitrosopumilaceae archaeon]
MTKFIRRLQKIGSSILVSLPKEWVDANNLDKSSQVELETGQDSLSISANKEIRPTKELVISYPLPKDENIVADITGAYLLGYDIIQINSKSIIPGEDREKIRNSMRRLVGMEIIEEDSSKINMQFLLDSSTLNPEKILKRMSSIALGMYDDVANGLISDDKSNLQTLAKRDVEVNRQYFLLVRLIRSTLVDKKLASVFNLENIDVLDYRIAANLLENAGDTIVELADSIYNSSLSKENLKKIFVAVSNFSGLAEKSIDAFTQPDRRLAIEAIASHRKFQENLSNLRTTIGNKKQIPIDFLDLVYMFERIAKSWADVADLVKPIYNE